MSFISWLRKLRSSIASDPMEHKHRRRRSVRAATQRPYLEALEGRSMPSFLAPALTGLARLRRSICAPGVRPAHSE